MMLPAREAALWLPQGHRSLSGLPALTEATRSVGGVRALAHWQAEHPECRVAHIHGERHGLWWEFPLADSFRWQGHLWRMRPAAVRQRMQKLAARFGLTDHLRRPVEDLTPAERAAADIAVALLPTPDLLLWEEPLATADLLRISHLVRDLCRAEGIVVVRI